MTKKGMDEMPDSQEALFERSFVSETGLGQG